MKCQSALQIIAKGLPYVRGMREAIARNIVDELEASGYRITYAAPEIPRVPSAPMAHVGKRNRERLAKTT